MTAAGPSAAHSLSIGAVLALLRPDFPDLSISKIRYLETEELVMPQRTPAGYRQFSPTDVQRLRFVLAAQRDRYLPLKVIKDQLDAIERGLEPDGAAARLPRGLVAASRAIDPPELIASPGPVRMTAEELLAESGLTAEQLAELESAGLVAVQPGGSYDADAALTALTLAELLGLGLETRHLRSLRTAAEREVGLVAQLVRAQSRQRDPDARQRAEEQATGHLVVMMRLHALLLKAALRRELDT